MSEPQAAKPAAPKKKPERPPSPCQLDPAASFERVAKLRQMIQVAAREDQRARAEANEKKAGLKKLQEELYRLIDDEQTPDGLFAGVKTTAGIKVGPAKPAEKGKPATVNPADLGDEWRTALMSAVVAEKEAKALAEKGVNTLGEYTSSAPEFIKGLEAKDAVGKAGMDRVEKAVKLWFVALSKKQQKDKAAVA